MRDSRRKSIRFRGKTEPVLDTFRVHGRNYFALEKISRRGAFRVFDPHAGPHGDYRVLYKLSKSQVSQQSVEILRRIGGPNGNRNFPGIVDFARQGDNLFVVVGWVTGTNLREYLDSIRERKTRRPTVSEVVRLVRGLVHGVTHYHRRTNIIHGDISPANIILTGGTTQLVLVDFGSAWPIETTVGKDVGDGVNGPNSFTVTAEDAAGNVSDTSEPLVVEIDTVPPTAPIFDLDPDSDSEPIGDMATDVGIVSLVGQTDPNLTVVLDETAATSIADELGQFVIATVPLVVGANLLTLRATDIAGNEATYFTAITRLSRPDTDPPVVTAALASDTGADPLDGLTFDATIVGTVRDDNTIAALNVGLDDMPVGAFVNLLADVQPDGTFQFPPERLSAIGDGMLADGSHTLRLQALDQAGNASGITEVAFTLDTRSPLASVSAQGAVTDEIRFIDVFFDEPMSAAAFDSMNYTLMIDAGPDTGQVIGIDSLEPLSNITPRLHLTEPLLQQRSFRLSVSPSVTDPAGNVLAEPTTFDFTTATAATITEMSPFNGEEMVSLAREAVVRFSGPVDPDTVTDESFYLIANGVRVPVEHLRVSTTEEFATIFPAGPLPASTEVRIVVDGDLIMDRAGFALDANGDGVPGGTGVADFRTVSIARVAPHFLFSTGSEFSTDLDNGIVPEPVRQQFSDKGVTLAENVTVTFQETDNQWLIEEHEGDPDGNPEPVPQFYTAHLQGDQLVFSSPTVVRGRVVASDFDEFGMDVPLEGVTIRVDGFPDFTSVTDSNGDFALFDTPAPEFFVHVDGSTTTHEGGTPVSDTGFYPNVGKPFHSIPGRTVVLEMGGEPFDVHLPFILNEAIHEISAGEELSVNLPPTQTSTDPQLELVELFVPADSLINDDGTPGTQVGIFQVESTRLPAPLPDGLDHSFDITVQANAPNFDIPAPITFSNTEGLGPGEQALLMSFDHAQGEWIVVGTMTVSEDGQTVVSDPGVGIRAPGWHGLQSGVTARGGLVLAASGGLFGRRGGEVLLPQTGQHFYAIENLGSPNDPREPGDPENFVIRGSTNVIDKLFGSRVLAPNTAYRVAAFGTATLRQGQINFVTPRTGTTFTLPTMVLEKLPLPDADDDGLNDEAEFIVGTGVNNPDTDGDGIKDLAELRQGLDPFDGRAFPTGIIANLPLLGEANEIVVTASTRTLGGQTAYIATGSHGLAVVDVSQFDNPVVLGQLDLPGTAVDDSIDANLQIVTVSAGSGGLQLVDVSDPMLPALRHTINVDTGLVEVVDGVAYAAVGTELRAYDLLTGDLLQRLPLDGSTLTGLAVEGLMLYTMDSSRVLRVIDLDRLVRAFDLFTLAQAKRGSVAMTHGAGKLIVGNEIAYAPAINSYSNGGYATANVTDPDNPFSISGSDVPRTIATVGDAFAANGSGIGLLVGRARLALPVFNAIDVMDVSDPGATFRFLTRFPVSNVPSGVTIASAMGYVTASAAGLLVANYLSFDSNGQPPTVEISAPGADLDPNADGIQVVEGTTIPIHVDLLDDDVQVRNVELLVDGQVVANDVSFPWNFSTVAPNIQEVGDRSTVQLRATDTGGNVGLSADLVVEMVPDTFAPTIDLVTPFDGSFRGANVLPVRVSFSEAMDTGTLTADNIILRTANGTTATPADIQFRNRDSFVQLTYESLTPGEYELVIISDAVTDRAGNELMGEDFVSRFTVVEADAVWERPESGFWDDPNNWENGHVPEIGDVVLIDAPGDITITYRQGTTDIQSLFSFDAITVSGGALSVSDTVLIGETFTMSGGTLIGASVKSENDSRVIVTSSNGTFDGVILNVDLNIQNSGILNVHNGLTLNGTATLQGGNHTSTLIDFHGTQTLDGSGEVILRTNTSMSSTHRTAIRPTQDSTLTIGPGIEVYGGGNRVQVGNDLTTGTALVNQGSLVANVEGQTLVISSELTNQGTVQAIDGGNLLIGNLIGNDQSTIHADGGTIDLVGTWTTNHVLRSENAGLIRLGGSFSSEGLTLEMISGGTMHLTGTMDHAVPCDLEAPVHRRTTNFGGIDLVQLRSGQVRFRWRRS